ncbi:MAG: ankyrin repeat domain-containing protein [Candidatus Eremiobacteraeota bacterium]|nr:ankyrin repeat domain-containing protein [Candidatus Eremiobacteraeota bacterium]
MARFCPGCGKKHSDSACRCMACGLPFKAVSGRGTMLDNRYEIEGIIKAGGMGCVLRAFDRHLMRDVAVKKCAPRLTTPEELRYAEERFKKEAHLLTSLSHRGLPRVTDFFMDADPGQPGKRACFLVMSLVEGEDLEALIQKGRPLPFPLEEALGIFRQLLDILHYLHSHDPPVIYRDLCPRNVMLDGGKVYLVDFGIARHFMPHEKGTAIGTPGYAAPEQYKGEASPLSDLFSLGALMHYLLTGENPEDRPFMHYDPVRSHNTAVPRQLAALIESMLSIAPQKRPPSAHRVLEALSEKGALLASLRKFLAASPEASKLPPKTIHEAIRAGDLKSVKASLSAGASLEARDSRYGATPLHWAAFTGRDAIARHLAARGADLDSRAGKGQTPLHWAAADNQRKTAALFLRLGADPAAADDDGRTALHMASMKGHEEMAALLVKGGASLQARDRDGLTPALLAIRRGHRGTARRILKACATLFQAIEKNDAAHVRACIAAGFRLGEKDALNGDTPLHRAASCGRHELVKLLLEARPPLDEKNARGQTPLHLAVLAGDTSSVIHLSQAGAAPSIEDDYGKKPLDYAVKAHRREMICVLHSLSYATVAGAIAEHDLVALEGFIARGIKVNGKDGNLGASPLHWAAFHGARDIAALLISRGASPAAKTKRGETPLDWAIRQGHSEVASLLAGRNSPPLPLTTPCDKDYPP